MYEVHKFRNSTKKQTNKKGKNNTITKKNIHKDKSIIIKNKTPKNINELSIQIRNEILGKNEKFLEVENSYSPTINDLLVSLKSIDREPVFDCNNTKAFKLKEKLKIGVPNKKNTLKIKCLQYDNKFAINQMLKALQANKHVDPDIIIPPVQHLSNCWFNTMFVSLFISDKGRKFFHYFRQLMIMGRQANNELIPSKLRDGFALLNYAIDASLVGNEYAYKLDTNSIIKQIYKSIPISYKNKLPYVTNVGEASNPMFYFSSLIYYLNNQSIDICLLQNTNKLWKNLLANYIKSIKNSNKMPHVMVIEFTDEASISTTNKVRTFEINGAKYELDSAVVRDIDKQHFCCLITCEGKEYAYDGASYHRLSEMKWKKLINKNSKWEFEGTNNLDGTPLKWNFRKGYQMLLYYRVK